MSTTIQFRGVTVNFTSDSVKLLDRRAVADGPAIDSVTVNINNMAITDRSKVLRMVPAYYLSLPLNPKKVKETVAANKLKSGEKFKDSAPNKDQEAVQEAWIVLLGKLMAGVDEQFMNWKIVLRALENHLRPVAEFIFIAGGTADKRLTKKGFHFFYLDHKQGLIWLRTMAIAYNMLFDWIVGGEMLNVKTSGQDIPETAEGWRKWILSNRATIPSVERPTVADANNWFADVREFIEKGTQVPANLLAKRDLALEIVSITRPSRVLLTRDVVKTGTKTIKAKVATDIMEVYQLMAQDFNSVFKLTPFNGKIEKQEQMNKISKETLSICNGLIAQFRILYFGGSAVRLGGNQAREVEAFNFKFI